MRRCRRLVFVAALAAWAADASPPDPARSFEPTPAQLLSTGNPNANDEDPSVLRARDGRMFVAWFSERGGNSDIYVTSTADGAAWSPAARVTTDPGGDFNPSLIQDEQGSFHLAWFRWDAPFHGHIWYNSSPDGLTWDPGAEVQVTRAFDVDDWVPTLTQAADGTLLVYFVSQTRAATNPATSDLYLAARRPLQTTWDPVVRVQGINSASEHDHLPFAARTGDQITMVWVRYDLSEPIPWRNPKSDLVSATSSNGLAWSSPVRVTSEPGNVVNLFPALFAKQDGSWFFLWLSTRLGTPKPFELPLAKAELYPQGLVENGSLSPGYSHRIAPTSTPGVYLGVWVQGPEELREVYYRFFEIVPVGADIAMPLAGLVLAGAAVLLAARRHRASRSALVGSTRRLLPRLGSGARVSDSPL